MVHVCLWSGTGKLTCLHRPTVNKNPTKPKGIHPLHLGWSDWRAVCLHPIAHRAELGLCPLCLNGADMDCSPTRSTQQGIRGQIHLLSKADTAPCKSGFSPKSHDCIALSDLIDLVGGKLDQAALPWIALTGGADVKRGYRSISHLPTLLGALSHWAGKTSLKRWFKGKISLSI